MALKYEVLARPLTPTLSRLRARGPEVLRFTILCEPH